MKIQLKLSRGKVVENVGHDVDVLVRLRAPAAQAGTARPPLCIVPVVDVSGSMEGDKLEAAKHALSRLVDHLVPGDRIALVAFATEVEVRVPIVEVTEARKRDLRHAIKNLRATSSTNLSGGLLEGLRLVHDAALPAGVRARVVLLTDGMANAGVATAADALVELVAAQAGGVTVSAFGYGDDCEHVVLAKMAEAGGGSFAYVKNPDVVMGAFARELGGLIGTYAADVRLRIVPVAGRPVEERLGDLLYHGELPFLARLAVPAHVRAPGVVIGTVEVSWHDTKGREQRAAAPVLIEHVAAGAEDSADDAEVAQARDEKHLELAQEEAERHARRGDFVAARQALAAVIPRLRGPALVAFVHNSLLPCYQTDGDYHGSSALRAGARAALKNRRQVGVQEDVAAVFGVVPSAAEVQMEQAFKGGGGAGKGGKRKRSS